MAIADMNIGVGHWPCTNDEYHGDLSCVGNSMLKVLRHSRKEYKARFVERTLPPSPQTPAQRFGSLFHLALLEPDRYAAEVCIVPEFAPDGARWDRRKKDHKAAWELWEQNAAGKRPVDELEDDRIGEMVRAVYASQSARPLIEEAGLVEHSVRWQCPVTSVMCKARRDKIVPRRFILDVKTALDVRPDVFARVCANYGYHNQAAFYQDGEAALNGEPLPFLFLCVCHKAPYEVAVYQLDDAAMELGRKQNLEALATLRACQQTRLWESLHERAITTIALPRWVEYQAEWQAEE